MGPLGRKASLGHREQPARRGRPGQRVRQAPLGQPDRPGLPVLRDLLALTGRQGRQAQRVSQVLRERPGATG